MSPDEEIALLKAQVAYYKSLLNRSLTAAEGLVENCRDAHKIIEQYKKIIEDAAK